MSQFSCWFYFMLLLSLPFFSYSPPLQRASEPTIPSSGDQQQQQQWSNYMYCVVIKRSIYSSSATQRTIHISRQFSPLFFCCFAKPILLPLCGFGLLLSIFALCSLFFNKRRNSRRASKKNWFFASHSPPSSLSIFMLALLRTSASHQPRLALISLSKITEWGRNHNIHIWSRVAACALTAMRDQGWIYFA